LVWNWQVNQPNNWYGIRKSISQLISLKLESNQLLSPSNFTLTQAIISH
jgi:hypothetical protein